LDKFNNSNVLFIIKISTIAITAAKEPSNNNIRSISEYYNLYCI